MFTSEYGYNPFWNKSVKMSKISTKFMILDFKKVSSHYHVHKVVLPTIKMKITNINQSTDKNVVYFKT